MRFASNFAYAFSDVNLFCRHRLCIHSQQTHREREEEKKRVNAIASLFCHWNDYLCTLCIFKMLSCRQGDFAIQIFGRLKCADTDFFSRLCLYLSVLAEINLNLLK